MTVFQLRTESDQEPLPAPAILLDWTGDGPTIQHRHNLTTDLSPPAVATDLLRFAGAIFCVDKLVPRPGTWTRSLTIEVPVHDHPSWIAAQADLEDTLAFLSGDYWELTIRDTAEPMRPSHPASDPVEGVCLFSGGLDSFVGAVDLLAAGKRVCLVAHYEGGQAPKAQAYLARNLARIYGEDQVVFRQIFLRPSPPSRSQLRPLPSHRESTTRTRSALFLAAGLVVAAGYGPDVPLTVPENGFIGINVPLTRARNGSLSTRTTHPFFIERFAECVRTLGITNPIVNPYRTMTKGDMLATSTDQDVLRAHARSTLSCAHPEAPRWAKREQGNCGYCFPCLIRRASMHHIGLDTAADYSFDVANEPGELQGHRGDDIRALLRSLNGPTEAIDVLRNGPVRPEEITAFADVYQRGRQEIVEWLQASLATSSLLEQLPTS